MGKVKAAKTEDGNAQGDEPALVVFGRDEAGRPHASTFTTAEVQLAERAAAHMSMSVLRITSNKHRALASELPQGRIFSSGRAFSPLTTEARYERLEAFGEAFQPELAAEPEPPAFSHVPLNHDGISVGALVLACEAPRNGFFESVVVGAPDDDLLELRWLVWPALPPFVRRRVHVALLTADLAETLNEAEPVAPDDEQPVQAAA